MAPGRLPAHAQESAGHQADDAHREAEAVRLPQPGRRVSYTPPVADGPDCPWARGRRTRWWLVVPADMGTLCCIAVLVSAARHEMTGVPEQLGLAVVAGTAAWLVAWLVTRPDDHLECLGLAGEGGRVGRGGLITVVVTWLGWVGGHLLTGADAAAPFALMLACFLAIGLGGWRWLYGFAKAQESVTPRAIRRRMEAQTSGELQAHREPHVRCEARTSDEVED